MRKRLFLVDVDGVLADNSSRLQYLKDKDYTNFYDAAKVLEDTLLPQADLIKDMLNDINWRDKEIALVTGRPERLRKTTQYWVDCNTKIYGLNYKLSKFRKDDDHRKSYIVKAEMVSQILDETKDIGIDEVVIIDDDPTNVLAMQTIANARGIQCNALIFGTNRLNELSGFVPSTLTVATPDTDKRFRKSLLSAFRERRNRHR